MNAFQEISKYATAPLTFNLHLIVNATYGLRTMTVSRAVPLHEQLQIHDLQGYYCPELKALSSPSVRAMSNPSTMIYSCQAQDLIARAMKQA